MSRQLTEEEKKTNEETKKHIYKVQELMLEVIGDLIIRAKYHDASKLKDPELPMFVEFTSKLRKLTYGSREYYECLNNMPALAHHYEENSHHPEHYVDGINDMTLFDIIEMLVDWKAATMRHDDGNLGDSLKHNKGRFGISSQLAEILKNTAVLLWGKLDE